MCGVFGFIGTDGQTLPLKTIKRMAIVTEKRGPHAFGFAWVDSRNHIHSYRQPGRISDNLDTLDMAKDARMLIGHCRWATHGDPLDSINNHPHPCDGGWMVHNGVIGNHYHLADEYDLQQSGDCDSEILALLIENMNGDRVERCIRSVALTEPHPLVMLGLWARPGRLIAVRRGNPLSLSRTKRGYFLASRETGMPGKPKSIRDHSVLQFTTCKGTVTATQCPF